MKRYRILLPWHDCGRIWAWVLAFSFGSVLAVQAATLTVPGQYPTIQAAVNAAASGDTILVAAGTYKENVSIPGTGKATNLTITGDGASSTIVDGSQKDSVFTIASGISVTLQWMTIKNGKAEFGGGISNEGTLTLTHCTLSGNSALLGGGIDNDHNTATLMLTDCILSGNSATGSGGGIINAGRATLTNCVLSGNSATYYVDWSYGGGINNDYNGILTLTNCVFSGNSSYYGGAIENNHGTATLTNCTFSGNSAPDGGVIENYDNGTATLTNCILWDDTSDEIYLDGGSATMAYSNVQGGLPVGVTNGGGNLDADPLFVRNPFTNGSSDYGDLHLQSGSPCRNAGNNALVTVPPFLLDSQGVIIDLDGSPRISGGWWIWGPMSMSI